MDRHRGTSLVVNSVPKTSRPRDSLLVVAERGAVPSKADTAVITQLALSEGLTVVVLQHMNSNRYLLAQSLSQGATDLVGAVVDEEAHLFLELAEAFSASGIQFTWMPDSRPVAIAAKDMRKSLDIALIILIPWMESPRGPVAQRRVHAFSRWCGAPALMLDGSGNVGART